MTASSKPSYEFVCATCGSVSGRIRYLPRTGCAECGSEQVAARYPSLTRDVLESALARRGPEGLWRYHFALPLPAGAHTVKAGEGNVPLDRWRFLETFAEEHAGVRCTVIAHRHDCQPATGSLKDLAASLVASSLLAAGIDEYVVCSTGNTGAAYASYLARAGITLHAFLPASAPPMKEAEIACFGQNVYRVDADYAGSKELAREFARSRNLPLSGGNLDPNRIEAKRTMVFHWLRKAQRFPDVYIQAVSGGTGPLAVAKGSRELVELGLIEREPRLLLSQPHLCDPMARAWRSAVAADFPEGWERSYPVVANPQSSIRTLATGKPSAYPHLAPLVRKSRGTFFTFPEGLAPSVAQVVAFETGVFIGPAASIGVGGFFAALREGAIANGDEVMIAISDGIRRDPDFLLDLRRPGLSVSRVDDCRLEQRADYGARIWQPLVDYVAGA